MQAYPWIFRGVAMGLWVALFSSVPFSLSAREPVLLIGRMLLIGLAMGLIFGVGAEVFIGLGNPPSRRLNRT